MSNIRVLVVDDEEMVRMNLVDYLEDDGYELYDSDSAESALTLLESQTVDIGIIDMRLTGMDGNSFILEAHRKNPEMKFLIHTGTSNYSLPESLRNIGITKDQIFIKPVLDMSILSEAIKKFV